MRKITAREILATPLNEIWNLPNQTYEVLYDDGEVHTQKQRFLIFDRYFWELILVYPQTPITYDCATAAVVGSGWFNADTHIKLFERIFKHIIAVNHLTTFAQKDPLLRRIYQIIDLIQNQVVAKASADVYTINATDFVDVMKSPQITDIARTIPPTPEGVEAAYKQIRQFVSSDQSNNRFIKAYRAKSINENQSNQCIGPRGFVTGLDRTVFRKPIVNGFLRGMGSLYEMMTESCTAAKSLNATGTHIQQSEYTSRRIQLLSMIITGIVDGDCGSEEYLPMLVTEQNIDALKGKFYHNDHGGLSEITGDDSTLYSKVLNLRTVLGCRHAADSTKICLTCLGNMGGNFENTANLGYTATAYLMEKVTQSILSTKHLTHSVRKSFIKLEGLAVKYFYSNDNGDLFFRSDIDLKGLVLVLPNSKVGKLVDVLNMQHTNISLSKIGELDTIYIKNLNAKPPVSETLNISYKDRCSVFTHYLLEYIKGSELESDSRGNFIIPLDRIDKTKPIFNNPLKETNIINFVNRIAGIIETNKDKVTDPKEKLQLLFDTTLEKFKCNLFVLEVLIYATTTYNAMNNNYRLGRNSATPYTEGKINLFRNRDFAALGSFEDQMNELKLQPVAAFSNHHKQDHPMAVFYMPKEVVARAG